MIASGSTAHLGPALPAPRIAAPYTDIHGHLRDELWRTWLRVEFETRGRWEQGMLPAVHDEAALGTLTPKHVGGIFRSAHADYVAPSAGLAHDMQRLLAAFVEQSALIEARIRATTSLRLPLVHIAERFRLTRFQQATLCFALMPELDQNLLSAFRYLSNDASCRGLDARLLAMLVYDTPESRPLLSRDLSPLSPLVRYRLLEVDEGTGAHDSMLYRRVRPSARLVQLLSGDLATLDPEVAHVAELRSGEPALVLLPEPDIARTASALRAGDVVLIVQGPRGVGKRLLLQAAADRIARGLLVIHARAFTALHPADQRLALQRLEREAILLDAVPVVPDVNDVLDASSGPVEVGLPEFLRSLLENHAGTVALTFSSDRVPQVTERPTVSVQLKPPTLGERSALWTHHVATLTDEEAISLAERFAIPGGVIAQSAAAAISSGQTTLAALDDAVHQQLHDRISRLGRRLDTHHTLDDLVVDDDVLTTLIEIVACVRERRQVRERWGFGGPPGVSVLFTGGSGVGKTMSAMVLAKQLQLGAYEIDLSKVMSKWIGETEKNLAEVFDAAEPGHVVLLFNEADSLFGKRTAEVGSSNDRYANLQTNYLLQRLERFGGLAILTTNIGKAIDPAFRRRFAYDVQFTFPTVEMREELWRRAIPAQARARHIDHRLLAKSFELSGGFIKVAAERGAYIAAAVGEPINHEAIVMAIERMYRERGKLITGGALD